MKRKFIGFSKIALLFAIFLAFGGNTIRKIEFVIVKRMVSLLMRKGNESSLLRLNTRIPRMPFGKSRMFTFQYLESSLKEVTSLLQLVRLLSGSIRVYLTPNNQTYERV